MIQIHEHLDIENTDLFLDSKAEELWNELNPKTLNGSRYKQNSLIEKCRKYANDAKTEGYLIEYAENKKRVARRHKNFFNFLITNNAKELKKIIVARPGQFAGINRKILTLLNEEDLFTGSIGNYSQTKFGKLLSNTIFNYTQFRSSEFCKRLFKTLGFYSITCPYCNETELKIVNLERNSSKSERLKAYLDIDHFFCQLHYPYFTISFYNLIPSCHNCNSFDKRDKLFSTTTHIHPYFESFDDIYQFKIPLKNILNVTCEEIDIQKLPNKKPLDRTLLDLNLIARYSTNLTQVTELIKYFKNYQHYLGSADEEIFLDAIFKLHGIPQKRKDILKFLKGKMKRDILKQLDINNDLYLL